MLPLLFVSCSSTCPSFSYTQSVKKEHGKVCARISKSWSMTNEKNKPFQLEFSPPHIYSRYTQNKRYNDGSEPRVRDNEFTKVILSVHISYVSFLMFFVPFSLPYRMLQRRSKLEDEQKSVKQATLWHEQSINIPSPENILSKLFFHFISLWSAEILISQFVCFAWKHSFHSLILLGIELSVQIQERR